MPYKKNRLQLKRERISADCSRRGKYGNEVKARLRLEQSEEMRVVAEVRTSGSLGNHHIELLDFGEPMMVWIRFDGEIYRPRTARGFISLLGRWMWRNKYRKKRKETR